MCVCVGVCVCVCVLIYEYYNEYHIVTPTETSMIIFGRTS